MAIDLDRFRLDRKQLHDVAQTLEARIREGLALDGREIRALPAYLHVPPKDLEGDALVVDAGGTNVRAATVRIGPEEAILAGPEEARLPVRGDEDTLDAEGFWNLQSLLVSRCSPAEGLPLGYCFSYPSEVHADRDATLLTWTKGVAIEGVEGRRVGAPLAERLAARGFAPKTTVVLNDTVAALLGGSGQASNPERVIGLIAGTGTNMATFFRPDVAPKLGASAENTEPMAVNLESGNFVPPFLTEVDDAFDAAGDKQGQQRFEKAVSGYALPYLFSRLVPDTDLDPSKGSAALVQLRTSGSGRPQEAANALLERSADLIAAGIYGVARVLGGKEEITVLAEGSLFWKCSGYPERVAQILEALAPDGPRFRIVARSDVNLYGSAAAALAAAGR